jgi:endonuclease/exonuclease/phosphatase (EEP) superfamily protein YafD
VTGSPRAGVAAPVAWDSTPRRRSAPRAPLVLAAVALVPALILTVLRVFPPESDGPALVAAFIPYALIGYAVAAVALLVALVRARRRAVLALVLLLVLALAGLHVWWLAPYFSADSRPAVGPSFRLMTQNVYKGRADLFGVAGAAQQADVVVLAEVTPDFLHRLETPAWRQRFPYAVGSFEQRVSDTAVFSRFPLSASQALGQTSFQQWVMTVSVPGRSPVRLIAAHPCNPFCGRGLFASDHALLRASVRANLVYPLVVAGDLNATSDHAPLQQLHRDGMRDAADLVGTGWQPTYPANRAFPPLIAIDHVLVDDQLTVTALTRLTVSGTDHRGLLATVTGTR